MTDLGAAEPGWYPYPGDPPGKVRRWSGYAWIGYPVDPPPGTPGYQAPEAPAQPTHGRRFKHQVALAPYAVLALAGLLATIIAGVALIANLSEFLDRHPDPTFGAVADEPLLAGPSQHGATLFFLLALFGGGLCFLAWLWRANANIGTRNRRVGKSRGHHFLMWIFFGWAYISWLALRPVLGPVVNSMFNCIERSGNKGSPGSWFVGVVWWAVWVLSSSLMVLMALALWLGGGNELKWVGDTVNGLIFAIGLHIFSLVCAVVLVLMTTVRQDRRLLQQPAGRGSMPR